MTKKLLITLSIIALFANDTKASDNNSATHDEGVVINGVRWATRNVDMPGTFAETSKDMGMLFQWNRRKAWNAVDRNVEDWDSSIPTGRRWYTENDPCPPNWRVPNLAELHSLVGSGSILTTKNGIYGRLFGTAPNQIFLPEVNSRDADGRIFSRRATIRYWSSTQSSTRARGITHSQTSIPSGATVAFALLGHNNVLQIHHSWRLSGHSIRCVAK